MTNLFRFSLILLLSSFLAAETPVSKSFFTQVAIGSKDTVAYHQQQETTKGSKSFTFEWHGAVWRFATQESRDKFAAEPERWVPEFNGFCANALSLGNGLVKTDGTVWQFFDNKLYLFYNKDGRKRWQTGDVADYRGAAEKAWSELTQE